MQSFTVMIDFISKNRSCIFLGIGLVSIVLHALHIQVRRDFLNSVASQCLHRTPFFKCSGFIFRRSHSGFCVKLLFMFDSLFVNRVNCFSVRTGGSLFSFWMNNGNCLTKKMFLFRGAFSISVFWDGNTSA